ncbi:hypothetical protein [Rhodococcoides fascians]|jgi:hypothetical protein|uniref:hypothetical protein n=1 Tax=Rhodococcoides fascians TaxID=1828 RepID=UPI00050C1F3C|nr:hypothetical protein [Rhodococcus fascians]
MGWAERQADKQEREREAADDNENTIERLHDYLQLHSHVTGGLPGNAGQYLDAVRAILNGEVSS